ncbi:MAG: ABC transporter permease [Acidimicrobiia bacterium]
MAVLVDTSRRARRARQYLLDLWNRREFAWFLAMGNLKARHASTALGLFWWVLNPLLLAAVYFLVFGVIFRGAQGPDYIGYLLSGIFVFHYTHHAMTGGAHSILQNSKLLANLRFPRLVLPIASLIEAAAGFLASLGVFYLIVIPTSGTFPGLHTALLLVIFPLHTLFNLGLGAITARLAVPFRDINNLVPYLTRLWLYLSPVIWPLAFLDAVSTTAQQLARLNPMFSVISAYRMAVLGDPFDPAVLWWSAAWSLGLALVGVGLFVKYEGQMVRHL